MNFNPYTQRAADARRRCEELKAQAQNARQDFEWHSKFNKEREENALVEKRSECKRLQDALSRMSTKLELIRGTEEQLTHNAKLGFNPRRWLSSDRLDAVKRLHETVKERKQHQIMVANQEATYQAVLEDCSRRKNNLAKFASTTLDELRSKVASLDLEAANLHVEAEQLEEEARLMSTRLAEPLAERNRLATQIKRLQSDIAKADSFDKQISRAPNGYEKKKVHDACGIEFNGEGSPSRVKTAKQKELNSAQRNLEKVDARLEQIVRVASRTITKLVIDGNNMCYEDRSFIGLDALLALTYALVGKYEILVVFDAAIRQMTRMSDREIANDFPREVRVHVVATKQTADETILESASGVDAYIVSNDRFRDFTDKSVVKGQRLIRHEIVDGRVLVHDLNVRLLYKQRHVAD